MVDSVFIYMDDTVGSSYASAGESSKKDAAVRVYDCICSSWFFIRHTVCAGTGIAVWNGFKENDGMDYCGTSMGLYSWNQQFFLRNFNYACHFYIKAGRKRRGEPLKIS